MPYKKKWWRLKSLKRQNRLRQESGLPPLPKKRPKQKPGKSRKPGKQPSLKEKDYSMDQRVDLRHGDHFRYTNLEIPQLRHTESESESSDSIESSGSSPRHENYIDIYVADEDWSYANEIDIYGPIEHEESSYDDTEDIKNKVDFVKVLPEELNEIIFGFLSLQDLKACSEVSTAWHEASNSSVLWRSIAEKWVLKRSSTDPVDKDKFTGISSNFLNKLRCFKVPSSESVRITEMNPWKTYHCQNNFLLYNWARGRYATHSITPEVEPSSTTLIKVVFPSKLPKDRLYLPHHLINPEGESNFYLLRLDNEPKIIFEMKMKAVLISCIARDCLVFIQDKQVKTMCLTEDSNKFKLRNVGQLFSDTDLEKIRYKEILNPENYYLTMDDDYIICGYKFWCLKIWYKQTYNLSKTFFLPTNNGFFSYCYYNDGCLYFSSWCFDSLRAEVQIYDMRKDKLEHTFTTKKEVTRILSNDKYFLLVLKDSVNRNLIEVRERETNASKLLFEQDMSENWGIPEPVVMLLGEKVFYLESSTIKIRSLNFGLVVSHLEVHSVIAIEQVSNHMLLVRLRDRIELWDWTIKKKLYTPIMDCPSNFNVYTDETRIVTVSLYKGDSTIRVRGFW